MKIKISHSAPHFTDAGPGSKDIATRVIDNGNGNIKVEYTPVIPGQCPSMTKLRFF